MDHIAVHHVPRHLNCHAEVLIGVHDILIVDFCDLLGLGIYENV